MGHYLMREKFAGTLGESGKRRPPEAAGLTTENEFLDGSSQIFIHF